MLTIGVNLKMFEKKFDLHSNLKINVKRTLPNELKRENNKFIPIQSSAYWDVSCAFQKEEHFLAKLYAALTFLTGESDSCYDDFKGSYSFMFTLNINKNHFEGNFIYHIYHYRSYIQFSVNEIVSKSDPRNPIIYHAPNDELFSNKDIAEFSVYFCGYVLEFMEGAKYTPKPFIKYSDSNLLLFGYVNKDYFTIQQEDYDQYLAIKNQICIDIGEHK